MPSTHRCGSFRPHNLGSHLNLRLRRPAPHQHAPHSVSPSIAARTTTDRAPLPKLPLQRSIPPIALHPHFSAHRKALRSKGPAMAMAGTERVPETSILGKKLPSNPTPLSAPQEQQVRDIYYKNVREKCAEEIKGTHSFGLPPSNLLTYPAQSGVATPS